ncbi:MAG TPA: exodeoxyribonuclease V subunit gamma, partial [Polyangiaceae bacterium]|nr:exodeoxyribonuclease V subunit gamma [Polyangiaceae bacterium]
MLERPVLGPLEPEVILIQSTGIERWLARELSQRLGVLAGARFPFPRAYVHEVLDAALGESPEALRYERETLGWLLFRVLDELAEDPALREVRQFLQADPDGSQRFFLAERLAHLFDQYVIYRPQLIHEWEQGAEPDDFQAVLWRRIREELGPHHFAERVRRLLQEVPVERLRELLPARICLVGGPGLPPRFLAVLGRLGEAIDVHVFSFTVSPEYLGAEAHGDPSDFGAEDGDNAHPLVVSLARVGADYQSLLEHLPLREDDTPYFTPPEDSVLHCLQRDIVAHERRLGEARLGAQFADDTSITLDACHSPLREVEALHDRLLGYFHADPALRAEDVVVLVPDIERYSPLISAVFGARISGERPLVPFRVADRSEHRENRAAAAFSRILDGLAGRMTASEVLDLLQLEPIRARFALDTAALDRIRHWVVEAKIRWGIDEGHRAEWGLPSDDANTWKQGLNRLVLGLAMSDDGETQFGGEVPFDDVTAGDADALNGLLAFCDALFELRAATAASKSSARSCAEWSQLLRGFIPRLIAESSEDWSVEPLHSALLALEARAANAGVTQPIPLDLVTRLLEAELGGRRQSTDFLAGGVTFCELLPLRTIPFRVICVLGLNQGEFPRQDRPLGYDRMARRVQAGDRSVRLDDRYLFLEMLLAARDRVSLSYVGRSIQDNSVQPPSVVVTELGLVLDEMFQPHVLSDSTGKVRPFLRPLEHPLQPFSARYFDGSEPRLASRSEVWLRAAEALRGGGRTPKPFWPDEGEISEPVEGDVTLEALASFFANPARAFLARLGVRIRDEIEVLEDREPIVPNNLERYEVGTRITDALARGRMVNLDIERRRADLPAGAVGELVGHEIRVTAERLVSLAAPWTSVGAGPARPVALELRVGGRPRRLLGTIDCLYGDRRVIRSWGRFNGKRRLRLWLWHLAACAADESFEGSVWIARGDGDDLETGNLPRMGSSTARSLLADLIDVRDEGIRRPLRFDPDKGWEMLELLAKAPG